MKNHSRFAAVAVASALGALALLLAACETPTVTPTTSPISPPPMPPAEALAFPTPASVEVTGTAAVYWSHPLMADGVVTVAAGVASGAPGRYVVYYDCQGPGGTCAGYPTTRVVMADTPDEACAVTMVLAIDLEARQGDRTVAATSRWTSLAGAQAPGAGQYDGDLPWSWTLDVPGDVSGTVKVWARLRWVDRGATALPNIVVPYKVDGSLETPDARGFFPVATFEVPKQYRYYFPVVGRND